MFGWTIPLNASRCSLSGLSCYGGWGVHGRKPAIKTAPSQTVYQIRQRASTKPANDKLPKPRPLHSIHIPLLSGIPCISSSAIKKLKHAKPFVFQEAAKSNKQATVSEQGEREDAALLRVYTHLIPLPRQSSPSGSTEGKEEEHERVERTSRGMTEGVVRLHLTRQNIVNTEQTWDGNMTLHNSWHAHVLIIWTQVKNNAFVHQSLSNVVATI